MPYSRDPCVDWIMHGVHDNNSRGELGKKARNKECDKLLKIYYNNCRDTDEKELALSTVFSDTLTSLVQAIESYRNGYFDASMVMVRNAIDASTYAALCYNLQFKEKTGKLNSIVSIDSVTKYRDYKNWASRKAELVDQKLLTSKQIDDLFKIRKEGDFSAHIYEIKRDRFKEVIDSVKQGKNELWKNPPKQFTTENENKAHLNRSIEILMELHVNYIIKQGMK